VGEVQAARRLIKELHFDIAFLDVNLPDGSGIDLLKGKVFGAGTAVVVMTAEAGVQGAVEAIRLGAADYLAKPFDPGELPLVINRVRKARHSSRIEEHRKKAFGGSEFFFGKAMAQVQVQLEKILAADVRVGSGLPPVLIEGETGTGKTTLARMLHQRGPRASQPIVEMNCSALPDLLAEAELFGHERGAFTDAHSQRIGLFEAADGGSLFLDELPSLSTSCQGKLLTALEDRRIRRLGSTKDIPIDVRVIAATNCDLKQRVAEGRFREDLLHRLDLFRIRIPPLKQISDLGKHRLLVYHWPGNVRELSHEIERAVVFEDGDVLDFDHLLGPVPPQGAPQPADSSAPAAAPGSGLPATDWFNPAYRFPPSGFSMEEAINRVIQHALAQTEQNVSGAARLLGVTRDYVRYRLEGPKKPAASGGNDPAPEKIGN
jgi:DNA-binding NtrC family response regulator